MKKTLMKTIMIATLLFCSNLKAKASSCMATLKKASKEQIVHDSNMIKNYQLSHMHAMQNSQNLKAYHISAKVFNPSHKVPTVMELANSIKSHPYFIGSFNKELSKEDYIGLKAKTDLPFFILETYQNKKSDFYMVYSKGVRHFSIKALNEFDENSLAGIDNTGLLKYPNIEAFTKCTLSSSYVDIYLT